LNYSRVLELHSTSHKTIIFIIGNNGIPLAKETAMRKRKEPSKNNKMQMPQIPQMQTDPAPSSSNAPCEARRTRE